MEYRFKLNINETKKQLKETSENKLEYLLALLPEDLLEDSSELHNAFFRLKWVYPQFLEVYKPEISGGCLFCEELTSAVTCLKTSTLPSPVSFVEYKHELPNMRESILANFEEELPKKDKDEFIKVSKTLKKLIYREKKKNESKEVELSTII